MRHAARKDRSQGSIIKTVRELGWKVFDTSRLGDGFPDMVVALKNGRVAMLFENKEQNGGEVTPTEARFMMRLVEPVYRIALSPEQVIAILQSVEMKEA
jgi:hypothetical protein